MYPAMKTDRRWTETEGRIESEASIAPPTQEQVCRGNNTISFHRAVAVRQLKPIASQDWLSHHSKNGRSQNGLPSVFSPDAKFMRNHIPRSVALGKHQSRVVISLVQRHTSVRSPRKSSHAALLVATQLWDIRTSEMPPSSPTSPKSGVFSPVAQEDMLRLVFHLAFGKSFRTSRQVDSA